MSSSLSISLVLTLNAQWVFKRLENGAFHIIAPTPSSTDGVGLTSQNFEFRATAKADDLLYLRASDAPENTDPNVVQEWEVLSSARDGGAIEPLDGDFKGYYVSEAFSFVAFSSSCLMPLRPTSIAARGEPKRVWMLPEGSEATQVQSSLHPSSDFDPHAGCC